MPEPDSSPSNPAPEGGDFTEALPELQAALQADSDDITDIKDEVSKIEIHTDMVSEKLFEIADNASSLADNTPSREEKQEQKAQEASRFSKLIEGFSNLNLSTEKVSKAVSNAGASLGTFIREKLALPLIAAGVLIATGLDDIFTKVTGFFSFVSSSMFSRLASVFTKVIKGINNAAWFKNLKGGVVNIGIKVGNALAKVGNFLFGPLKRIFSASSKATGLLSKVRSIFSSVGKVVGKIFNIFWRVFKTLFKFLKPIMRFAGKIYFAINVIIGIVQGVMDFFKAPPGKRGGLGGLLKSIIGGLLETFTFGLIDIERIYAIFDNIVTGIKLAISAITSPLRGGAERDQIRAEALDRELARTASRMTREMRREGKTEEEIRDAIMQARAERLGEVEDEDVREAFDQIASGDSAFQESLNKLGAAVEQVNANVNTVNNTAARTQLDSATNTATPSVGSAMVPASDPDRHDFGSMGLRGTAMF